MLTQTQKGISLNNGTPVFTFRCAMLFVICVMCIFTQMEVDVVMTEQTEVTKNNSALSTPTKQNTISYNNKNATAK